MSELTMLGVLCVGVGVYALWLDAQLDRARLVVNTVHGVLTGVADGEVVVYRDGEYIKVKESEHGTASQGVN